jgi:hypothetical protein
MSDLEIVTPSDKLKLLQENFPKIELRKIREYLVESSWNLQKAW